MAIITPQNCADLSAIGIQTSGSYYVGHPQPFQVSCDMDTADGGWTVIQRRQDGSVAFNKLWTEYVQGFGNVNGELWLGLEHLHTLTTPTQNELYVYLEDWEGNSRHARYSTFSVGASTSDYRATLSGYMSADSDVDDDLTTTSNNGRHSINGRGFATTNHGGFSNCAVDYGQGGWWYPTSCGLALLNGQYLTTCSTTTPPSCSSADGIVWKAWKTYDYSLRKTTMMIRPGTSPPSSLNTCQNGGTLTPGMAGSGVYTCTCPAGFGGTYCDQRKEGDTCDTYTGTIITPQSCADLSAMGIQTSGTYHIGHPQPFQVSCDMGTDGGGWTVIQRRQDGSVQFNKPWAEYVQGFGDVSGELWLGLEHLHTLTTPTQNELYVYLEDWEGNSRHARYSTFSVGASTSDYRATLSGYMSADSDVDDDLTTTSNNGRHSINSRGFATTNHGGFSSCAVDYGQGGWWYPTSCGLALLNGRYLTTCSTTTPPSCSSADGIVWKAWKTYDYSLRKTTMMIRPGTSSPSSLNTCQNGGTLTPGMAGSGVYTCTCPAGFGGTYCDQRKGHSIHT
ncbi:PREDICTED: uncharacterized protein LOC109480612 [Branchiostoma belcheri]|uniref:Uncharacterized protein LOC109480612 n=1 Tax=Branchiostoma belcheri TaxID=7741 RepID=A0A6P5A9G2_BRABE|nr:PREDICTED: uncharacterized protein LOC109480612 [Branchiostoma belcheri]